MKKCLLFLRESDDNLDVGFSLQFRAIVNKHGGETKRLDFLSSTPVQEFLEDVSFAFLLNSLDAERLGAKTKHKITRKMSHISTVSCELQCARFHMKRLAHAREIMDAEKHF